MIVLIKMIPHYLHLIPNKYCNFILFLQYSCHQHNFQLFLPCGLRERRLSLSRGYHLMTPGPALLKALLQFLLLFSLPLNRAF